MAGGCGEWAPVALEAHPEEVTGSRIRARWSELTLSERNQLHREGRDLVPSAVTGSPPQPGVGGQLTRGEGSETAVVEEMLGGH